MELPAHATGQGEATMTQPINTLNVIKVKGRPLGLSLAPWREWVEADDPKERLFNGNWNRTDRVILGKRRQ
jgi:hypothetical protein